MCGYAAFATQPEIAMIVGTSPDTFPVSFTPRMHGLCEFECDGNVSMSDQGRSCHCKEILI